MDVLTLLDDARRAGLQVRVDGDRLIITGPRSAAHLAQRLGRHKADITAHLTRGCCQTSTGILRPTIQGDRLFCHVCGRRIGADTPYPWSDRPRHSPTSQHNPTQNTP